MQQEDIRKFKTGFHYVKVSTEAIRSYLTLPWDNPREFKTVFEERSKGFHQENSAIRDAAEREYSNVRSLDVLWKPFKYNYALSQVWVRLQNDLTSGEIQEIFKEAKLKKDGKEVTAEELFDCPTPELRENLPGFVLRLIAAQIFFNRISYYNGAQNEILGITINTYTQLTTYEKLVERYFSNLKSHGSPLDIETYFDLNDDDRLIPRETLSDFFRIMFSPPNICKSEVAANRPKADSSGTAEGMISYLFLNSASVVNVRSLMISLLEESDKNDGGASYKIDMPGESSDTQNLPFLKKGIDNGTLEEERGSIVVIRSDFKATVQTKFDTVANPLLIELKSYNGLRDLFEKCIIHSNDYRPDQKPPGSGYWFNLLNQALTYAQASLSPFVMISNMLDAYIIRLPLEEQIRGDLTKVFSQCDIYGPVNLRTTPVSLLVSVIVFQGIIEYRELLQGNSELLNLVDHVTQLKRSSSMHSYLWTYGAPEETGKKKRDIERQKFSMLAFKVCLGLEHSRGRGIAPYIRSELITKIRDLRKKVLVKLGFYVRKNERKNKPPIEPELRHTRDFVYERLLKGGKFYSRDLATAFVVREMNHEKNISPKSTILKVFDPVKLNCIDGDEMAFDYITELNDRRFSHNVYCLISECFLREVGAYLLLMKKLESYSDYVPELLSYGFLEDEYIRDDSITREDFYDFHIKDSSGIDLLNQQGGFVLIEHLLAIKNPDETIGEDERVVIAKQGVNALREIHSAGILHGDIKRDKVILTKSKTGKPVVKIIDFGHALKSKNSRRGEKRGAHTMEDPPVLSEFAIHEPPIGFFQALSEARTERKKKSEIKVLQKVLVDMLGLEGVEIEWGTTDGGTVIQDNV